jgi:N-acetylglucosaminyl-diphospho-decaprenol L-rhamnosyltransferase
MAPLVSAIVLNTWAGRKTVACVRSLLDQTIADRIEVIIIDNHSQDDSIQYIRNNLGHLSNVRILEARTNLGFGGGYGLGIEHAQGEYVLINNPDKLLEKKGIEKMLAALKEDPAIGILAPKLVYEDGTMRPSARAFPRPLDVVAKRTMLKNVFPKRVDRYLRTDQKNDMRQEVDWVVGGCFFARADFLRDLRGFDKRFFLFFEDIDLCRRTWAAGKKVVFCSDITATDRKRRLSEMNMFRMPLSRVGRAHLASAWRYFRKWKGQPLPNR